MKYLHDSMSTRNGYENERKTKKFPQDSVSARIIQMTKNNKMSTRQRVHEKYENERKTTKCPQDSVSTRNIKMTKKQIKCPHDGMSTRNMKMTGKQRSVHMTARLRRSRDVSWIF